MTTRNISQWKFRLLLAMGALVALVLCAQCVRTFLYTGTVLVPQQARLNAERQAGSLGAAARSASVSDPRELAPVIEHAMESIPDQVLWMRVVDANGKVLAQGGRPQGELKLPPMPPNGPNDRQQSGSIVSTPAGKAFVIALPLRMPRPQYAFEGNPHRQPHSGASPSDRVRLTGDRPPTYLLELAIPLNQVARTFDGLRRNLIVGMLASIGLLIAVTVIGLCAPRYVRGSYLENELRLARRVQSDLQPKPHLLSPAVEFAASSIAADHVGGDFYDVFDAGDGKVAIVLGDVSGKGVPAALLVSVLQGAIRSSNTSEHEYACERINRMLCEQTACERFVTLFWGVFDPATRIMRYVNAGHAAPLLLRGRHSQRERLSEGGPVLGILPHMQYSAGTVKIEHDDVLVLYSDGINEATNDTEQEFGEARIERVVSDRLSDRPKAVCDRIMTEVAAFASAQTPADDRTLLVVRFPQPNPATPHRVPRKLSIAAPALA